MKRSKRTLIHRIFFIVVVAATLVTALPATLRAQLSINPISESVLDPQALLMPSSATFGRALNNVSFQTEALMTHGGYQFATWYHLGNSNEHVYLARRQLGSSNWEVMDTGGLLINGDGTHINSVAWNAHNVISMGISNDGVIHIAYDHHGHTLRYVTSSVNTATGSTWNNSIFNAERSSLNVGGPAINGITYPRFINQPDGNLLMAYRSGGSGNGMILIASYDSTSQSWSTPQSILSGSGTYTDRFGSSSTRNAYVNGFDYGPDGSLHVTFTWREKTGGANHDIGYMVSTDNGATWQNNAGQNVGSTVSYNSPGIHIATMDRSNTLINQQAQAVDLQGGVHTLMWHRRFDEPGFQWQSGDPGFFTNDAAYYHYYRDPVTGDWTRQQLPTEQNVGSRPKIAYDAEGNIYAVYTSPDTIPTSGITYYADGNLIIAGATKASGYSDWSILFEDTRLFSGEPLIDQDIFLNTGLLSILIQEASPSISGATSSNLYVLNFAVQAIPETTGASVLLALVGGF
jgi:hypothetical protein